MSSGGVYANLDKCEERREDDFYPTPWEPIEALLDVEKDVLAFHPRIWEPACGDGAISQILQSAGFKTYSTDLVDRGYGDAHFNFLQLVKPPIPSGFKAVITNPPFNLAEDFIRRCFALDMRYVALLLKAHYYHADARLKLFHDHPPARIYPLGWRVDFTGGGANHTDCSWYVWDANHRGPTFYMPPIKKPRFKGQPNLL